MSILKHFVRVVFYLGKVLDYTETLRWFMMVELA